MVRSAVAGVVTTPKPREKIGQYLKKGDLVVEVHEFETVRAEIAIPDREIGDVKVGQAVVVKARAYPERAFQGREGWRGKVFRVTTALENPDLLLRPEMTGTAKIYWASVGYSTSSPEGSPATCGSSSGPGGNARSSPGRDWNFLGVISLSTEWTTQTEKQLSPPT